MNTAVELRATPSAACEPLWRRSQPERRERRSAMARGCHRVAKTAWLSTVAGPTIYDVAARRGRGHLDRLARVLQPRTGSTPRTRDRILAVAAELGYRPNPHARALLSGRHHTVAMVVSDITNPHYFELIRGAEHAREGLGVHPGPGQRRGVAAHRVRPDPAAGARRSTGSCSPPVGSPTRTCEQIAVTATGRADEPRAARARRASSWTTSRAAARSSSTWRRSATGDLVYLAGPRNSWMATTRWARPAHGRGGPRGRGRAGSGRSPPRSPRAGPPPTAP